MNRTPPNSEVCQFAARYPTFVYGDMKYGPCIIQRNCRIFHLWNNRKSKWVRARHFSADYKIDVPFQGGLVLICSPSLVIHKILHCTRIGSEYHILYTNYFKKHSPGYMSHWYTTRHLHSPLSISNIKTYLCIWNKTSNVSKRLSLINICWAKCFGCHHKILFFNDSLLCFRDTTDIVLNISD